MDPSAYRMQNHEANSYFPKIPICDLLELNIKDRMIAYNILEGILGHEKRFV